jgi:TPR repeat protein
MTGSRAVEAGVRLGRMVIAGVLAAGLVAMTGPAHADGGADAPPRPSLKPLLLEPLVWEEACQPAHTRVDLPVGRMSVRMRETWRLPQTADPAAWGPSGLYLLAYAHETGEMGLPDPAEAARIYCLVLRHYGETVGAHLLARLHARGEGVAFSPVLADHFARVALGWHGQAPFEHRVLAAYARRGLVPDDPSIAERLQEAEAWRQRVKALPPRERYAVLRRFTPSGGRPRSDLLLRAAFRLLAHDALRAGEIGIVMAYLDYALARHATGIPVAQALVEEFWFPLLLRGAAVEHRHAPAQALAGRMYLAGIGHEVAPAAAYLFFRAAREQGHPVAVDLESLLARVPDDMRAGLCEDIAFDSLPNWITTPEHLERFHSGLRAPLSPDRPCTLP